MNLHLEGKTALVTASTAGIGLAIAQALAEEQFFEHMRPTSLIQRFADTREVANLVVYVCSPLSSATNGAALRVDGGVVRAIP